MSKTVDERIVEMRFDNSDFEKNVSTSMSTLDKLKQSLKLSDASKGLENVSSAAKRVDMSGLSNGIETVHAKFSALDVVAVTALTNITNSAVNAGKKIVSALTIDPVKSGFSEYEMKMDSVRTIVNGVVDEYGSYEDALKAVNGYLEELNTYSDETIYSFQDMTQNIGKFTNAGVGLEDAVQAIKGISNEAAASGANANEASRAMYNFAQALSSGAVKLIDWKSIENANMATVEFKQALLDSAVAMGTLTKTSDGMYDTGSHVISATQNFNDALQDQWMTTDVLINTLGIYATDVTKLTDAEKAEYEAKLKSLGYTDEQIVQMEKLGTKATEAATKVTKFSQMWDVLKETAQSGWAQTWELLVGDLEQAKAIFSQLTEFFGNIIDGISKTRNKILEIALGDNSPIGQVINTVNSIKKPIETITKTVENAANAYKEFDDSLVNSVIRGDWGNYIDRYKALTEAGYNWVDVQNKVNEALGCSYRRTEDEFGILQEYGKAVGETTESQEMSLDQLVKLNDEKLKELGLTDDEIKSLRLLSATAKNAGMSIEDYVKSYDGMTGREKIVESFKNIGSSIVAVCKAIKEAWRAAIWGGASDEEIIQKKANALTKLIDGLYWFTTKIKNFTAEESNIKKITAAFKGLFDIVSVLKTIFGGGFAIALEVVKQILGAFDMTILDLAASAGEAASKFREWFDAHNYVGKAVQFILPYIVKMVEKIKELGTALGGLDRVKAIVTAFKNSITGVYGVIKALFSADELSLDTFKTAFKSIGTIITRNFSIAFDGIPELIGSKLSALGTFIESKFNLLFSKLPENVQNYLIGIKNTIEGFVKTYFPGLFGEIPGNLTDGLINGLADSSGGIISKIIEIGKMMLEAIKGVLGIHSPSTEGHEIGENFIQGVINGIGTKVSGLKDKIKEIGSTILDTFKNIDFSKITSFGILAGMGLGIKKFLDIIWAFASPFKGAGDILKASAKVIKESSGEIENILKNVGKVVGSFSKVLKAKAFEMRTEGIKNIAISIGILAASVYVLAQIDSDKLWPAVEAVAVLAAVLVAITIALSKLSKSTTTFSLKDGLKMEGGVNSIIKVAASLLILAIVIKMLGSLTPEQYEQGIYGMAACIIALGVVLVAYSRLVTGKQAKNIDKLGSMLLKLSIAMYILVKVCKLAGQLTEDEMIKGAGFAFAFVIFVGALSFVTKTAGKNVDALGNMVIKLSITMIILVKFCKMAGKLSEDEMLKGAAFAFAFVIFVGMLSLVTRFAGDSGKIAGVILAISFSMLLMVGVVALIGLLSEDAMKKGAAFAAAFLVFVWALFAIAKNNKQAPKIAATLFAMAIAIGILAGICILLGFIDTAVLAKGLIAVGILGAIMVAMIKATKGANDCYKNLIVMVIAIAVMAAAVFALSFLTPEQLFGPVAALAILMGMFALMEKCASSAKGSEKAIVLMLVVVIALAAVIYILGNLPMESALTVSESIAILMLSMSVAMLIASKCGKDALKAVGALALMSLVVFELGLILAALSYFKIDISLETVASLAILLIAMAAACAIVSKCKVSLTSAIDGALGLVAFVTIIGLFMSLLAEFADADALKDGGDKLALIGYAIGNFIGSILGGFAAGLTSGLPEMAEDISAFATGLQPFFDEVNGLDDNILDKVGRFVEVILMLTGASFVNGIANMLSGFVGESSIEALSSDLVTFGQAIADFSDTVSGNIDEAAVEAATNAGLLMTALAQDIPGTGGLLQKILGEKDLAGFGEQLVEFGDAIVEFSDTVSGNIDEGAVEAASNAGLLMSALAQDIPGTDGVLQWIKGEQDLAGFGEQLVTFGECITEFSDTVAGNVDTGAVQAASDAGLIMSALAQDIPGTDGVLQWIKGEQDLADFGTKLVTFGESITAFSDTVTGNIDSGAVQAASDAGSMMASLAQEIPESGGLLEWIKGGKGLDKFGEKLVEFGQGIVDFSTTVSGNVDETAINTVVDTTTKLNGLNTDVQTNDSGSFLENFASKLKSFGEHFKKMSDELSDVDTAKVESVSTASTKISTAAKVAGENEASIPKLETLGESAAKFATKLSEIKSIDTSKSDSLNSSVLKLSGAVTKASEADTSGVDKFVSAVEKLGNINVGSNSAESSASSLSSAVDSMSKTLAKASTSAATSGTSISTSLAKGISSGQGSITNATTSMITTMTNTISSKAGSFVTIGLTLMRNFVNGLRSGGSSSASTVASCISSAASIARNYYSSFYSAGYFVASGLASGMSSQLSSVRTAAAQLAAEAEKVVRAKLQINSPSKVFRAIGAGIPEGLVQGMDRNAYTVVASAKELAGVVETSFTAALSKAYELLTEGTDMQPTIRPVLDLSDVENGANGIAGLFDMTPSVDVMSNVGSISTMMNRRIQNGANSDVVTAIDKLSKQLEGVSGDTYNVGGITYDDGSNVSNAVRELVRAARIERRI